MILESIANIQVRLTELLQAKTELYDPGNPDPTKRGLTSTSQVAAWRSFLNVVATEIFTLQQMMALFEAEVEAFIQLAAPATAQWIQDQVFKFQYSATTPQILQLDTTTFTADYPVIDDALKIVTRCSVLTTANRTVSVKVAKGATPGPLAGGEVTALEAYLDLKLPAGVKKSVVSLTSDKVFIDAEIFYNGQYTSVISANVIAALDAYLAAIPFNGALLNSAIEDAIQSVEGVTDVQINQVKCRADATPFSGGTVVARKFQTIAGYIVQETTTGETFADSLTFTVES